MPAPEIAVDITLVRRLLRSQLPDRLVRLAEAPLELLGQGWDNVLFRLGEDHVVRLPVRRVAAELAENEIAWVETASVPLRRLGLAVPLPVFVGAPGPLLPWRWTIVPYIPGEDLTRLPVPGRDGVVEPLARALVALHRPAPPGAPRNPYRGVALHTRAMAVRDRWPAVSAWLGTEATGVLRERWGDALQAADWLEAPRWIHGDVHPLNILQRDGRLAGLIDFGDLCAGDPAVDLAVAWLAFSDEQRRRFWAVVGTEGAYDDAIEARAAGWAVVVYTALVADPVSRRSVGTLLEDIRDHLG